MKRCRRMRERALRELDRELNIDEALELDAHLAECDACREFVRSAQSLEGLLQSLGEPPVEQLDIERNVLAIRERIASPTAVERRRSSRVWPIALAVAASVALLAWRFGVRSEGADAPQDDSSRREVAATVETVRDDVAHDAGPVDEVVAPSSEQIEALDAPASQVAAASVVPEESSDASVPGAARSAPSFDAERHEAARTALREVFVSAAAQLPALATTEQASRFADQVDALASQGGLSAWPLPRLAATLLDDASPGVARAAIRYVGLRGDRLSAAELERRAAEDLEALLARVDRLDGDSVAVRAACLDPERSEFVLERLAACDEPTRLRVLRGALEARPEGELRERLLDRLVQNEPFAVDALARLAFDGWISPAETTRAFHRISLHPESFIALATRPGERLEAWIDLAAFLRVEPLLPWLEALARQPRTREVAVAAVARVGGCASLDALLRLIDAGVAPVESFDLALDLVLDRDARGLRDWVEASVATKDARVASRLLDALAGSRKPPAALGLLSIAVGDNVALEERELALDALGDLAAQLDPEVAAEAIDELTRLFRTLETRERRLAAACVISIQRLGGAAAVDRLLAGAPRRASQRVLDVIAGSAPRSVSRVQLARALEPWLDARTEAPRGGSL